MTMYEFSDLNVKVVSQRCYDSLEDLEVYRIAASFQKLSNGSEC